MEEEEENKHSKESDIFIAVCGMIVSAIALPFVAFYCDDYKTWERVALLVLAVVAVIGYKKALDRAKQRAD